YLTVTGGIGANCRGTGDPPGAVAVADTVRPPWPAATGSNTSAASSPAPATPVISPGLTMAMSTRPVFASPAWVKVALIPPERMKLPSATARIRSTAGLYVTVTATLEIWDAPEMEIGTL